MANPITVRISVDQLGTRVFEIRGVMKGQFYKRLYVGYDKQSAIKLFQEWLGTQL